MGNAEAMNRLGVLYNNGIGVERDHLAAMELYQKAAEKGNIEEAKSSLFKCFDMDKDYILVLSVAMKRDKTINNKEELIKTLKALRKEYKDKK